jgi:predicted nuclease with TOPRIM domain
MFQGQKSTCIHQATEAITTDNYNKILENNYVIENSIEVALEKLQAAKHEASAFRSAQEFLASEKAGLESAVETLKEEKTQLEIAIEKMKFKLSDLGDQLAETQNETLTQVFTTIICEQEPEVNDEPNDADDEDSLQHDDWKEDGIDGMLLDSHQATVLDTQPTNEQHAQLITPLLLSSTSRIRKPS